jgi:hypothetical protein
LFACFGVEFPDEFLGVFPAHFLYRAIVSTIFKLTGIVTHNRSPLSLGNFSSAQCKNSFNRDPMDGQFVGMAMV